MDSIYIVSSIIILIILFLFFNFLFLLMVKNQTRRAVKEIDDYLKRKIELAAQIVSGISKYASRDSLKNIEGFLKKLLKTKPFGVIYDLFKKEAKKVKKKINKKKK